MDLRGALTAFEEALPEIGGYWLCRLFLIASGALGGSIAPEAPDVVEDTLLCRVEVLCRRKIELVLAGLGPVGPRPTTEVLASVIVVFVASVGFFSPVIFGSTMAVRSKLKSLDAVAILLCRSSKLGEGRKS